MGLRTNVSAEVYSRLENEQRCAEPMARHDSASVTYPIGTDAVAGAQPKLNWREGELHA